MRATLDVSLNFHAIAQHETHWLREKKKKHNAQYKRARAKGVTACNFLIQQQQKSVFEA